MAISEQLQQRINNLTQGMGEINPPSRPISNKEMEIMRQTNPMAGRMGSANSGFYTDAPMPATSDREMEMFRDASPSNMQFDVEIDGKNRQFGFDSQPDEQAMQMLRDRLGVTKGAISNREMEMFRDAVPSMGTMGSGMGAISDQERQMFMDSMPRQTDETQQAINSLQQELQMTTDPEEAEGLGRMIQKLSLEMMAPMGGLAKQLAQAGGGEDTALAHVRPGEIVLPPEMMQDPKFEKMVEDKFKGLGIDPAQAVVGIGIASLNQSTAVSYTHLTLPTILRV